ncbi:MAG TPA: hypothetical protein VFE15_15035 [Marmoricola sp.]|jgi:hypothetical protein|nr:hypothetical protein [Marmoricola sp.]
MRSKLTTLLTVIGVTAVLVLAGNTVALAATGHSFLLGKSNSTPKATTLTRTKPGAVLSLHAKSAANAPLIVNGSGKVTHLNADKLDGYDSTQMINRSYLYTGVVEPTNSGYDTNVPAAAGTYAFSFSAFLLGASGSSTYCKLETHHGTATDNIGVVSAASTDPGLSASGEVRLAPGDTLEFICGGSATSFATQGGSPVQILLTPIASLGGGTLTAK